ncbi:MAG TPA: FtsX-like permease family protein [Alphaproteobacteria bacterium]
MSSWALAWRLARREMRGGFRGFRIFLACLMLGVAAIAGVGSIADGVHAGLDEDARQLLGGDVDLTLTQRAATPDELQGLAASGTVSRIAEMRAMARTDTERTLVELKAVDGAYPLLGAVALTGDGAGANAPELQAALSRRDGEWGAAVEPATLVRLGVRLGDRIKIGDQTFVLRAVGVAEPDRTTNVFTLGPRVLVSLDSLPGTGLMQPGSLIRYQYRLLLNPGLDAAGFAGNVRQRFPDAGWRIRTPGEATPGVQRWVDRIAMFLTLVGLTALLVGGVGVANAVRSYLAGKTATIATLKCLGGSGGLILRIYLIHVMAMAAIGIGLGLLIGAVAPVVLVPLLANQLPVPTRIGIYPVALAMAAAFGILTAVAFSLWPLARAREVPPSALFRDLVAPARRRPRPLYAAIVAAALLALAALAVIASSDHALGFWFVVAAFGTFLVFRGAAVLIAALARRTPHTGRPGLRLALANLHRPGSPAPGLVLSLGLGLTVLTLITLVQGNITRELREQIPDVAPTFFFIDIQPDQVAAFDALLAASPGVGPVRRVPSLRGRIVKINSVPVEQAAVKPDAQWAVNSDRGLTYSAEPPIGSRIVAGKWWPADYAGPPLLSMDAQIAAGMGLKIGDALTVNVLGREVEAKIANLRAIDWTALGINYVLVFAPGTLEGAPQTHIATAQVAPGYEDAVERAVTQRFPNVSTIRVKDALALIDRLLGQIATAARVTASLTLLTGTLVLAGAVIATHRRRVYDAVVFKVLGARRRSIVGAFAIEFGLIGLATAIVAMALGTLSAWLLMTWYLRADFVFLPMIAFGTAAGAAVVVVALGLAGTWRALGQKPAPLLRNP